LDNLVRAAHSTRPSAVFTEEAAAHVDVGLEGVLYNALAKCKLKTAAIAMHLDADWRKRFFSQLDNLLDVGEWDEHDVPVTISSFTTLLRFVVPLNPERRPGIGATSDGHIIVTWTSGQNRLTIECLPDDQLRWVVVYWAEGDRETASGITSLDRILTVLAPYCPECWFSNEKIAKSAG